MFLFLSAWSQSSRVSFLMWTPISILMTEMITYYFEGTHWPFRHLHGQVIHNLADRANSPSRDMHLYRLQKRDGVVHVSLKSHDNYYLTISWEILQMGYLLTHYLTKKTDMGKQKTNQPTYSMSMSTTWNIALTCILCLG